MDRTKEELQETIRQQAIKNGQLTEQLQAAEIECVRLNNRIEELESMISKESDLVSRIALRNALYDADAITMQGVKIINQFPAADVEPVKHGRIIESIENGKMKRVFSCCGEDFTKLTMWLRPNYCPNCGTKMGDKLYG